MSHSTVPDLQRSWITFLSRRSGGNLLYRMHPDGSDLTPIFGGELKDLPGLREDQSLYRQPHWSRQSPDGRFFLSWARDVSSPEEKYPSRTIHDLPGPDRWRADSIAGPGWRRSFLLGTRFPVVCVFPIPRPGSADGYRTRSQDPQHPVGRDRRRWVARGGCPWRSPASGRPATGRLTAVSCCCCMHPPGHHDSDAQI